MHPSTRDKDHKATNEISWPTSDGGRFVKNKLATLDGKVRGTTRGMAKPGTISKGLLGSATLRIICHTHLLFLSVFSARGIRKRLDGIKRKFQWSRPGQIARRGIDR